LRKKSLDRLGHLRRKREGAWEKKSEGRSRICGEKRKEAVRVQLFPWKKEKNDPHKGKGKRKCPSIRRGHGVKEPGGKKKAHKREGKQGPLHLT